jgi:hypothetical protein
MTQYVGLDVSMRETKLYVLDEAGQRVSGCGVDDVQLTPLRLLRRCVGMRPLRCVLGSRLDR